MNNKITITIAIMLMLMGFGLFIHVTVVSFNTIGWATMLKGSAWLLFAEDLGLGFRTLGESILGGIALAVARALIRRC